MSKLIIVDGNSIANRAFYALPLLSNSGGLHTNAALGFTTMLLRLIEEEQPTHFLVAFDAGKVTFRHQDFKEYKGGRSKTPPELSEQFPLIKELLQAFNITQFELAGYEADDIIGTLTRRADREGMEVLVVSGDKDMLQLSSEHVTVALTRKGISEMERYSPATVMEKYGLTPLQIIDLKGLMGDASDNIPGIPGVGEKTALKLLHEYGTVEEVLNHACELKGKMKEKVEEHAEEARMSKQLATIFREVEMDMDWDELQYASYEESALAAVFRKLEFKSLLERMELSDGIPAGDEGYGEIRYHHLRKDEMAAFAGKLPAIKACYVETIGDNPHMAEVAGISLYTAEQSYYLPIEYLDAPEAEPIRDWLADGGKEKWLYDYHGSVLALAWRGITLKGCSFDVLLAGYLLDPTGSDLALSGLASRYSLPPLQRDEEVYGKGAKFQLPAEEVLGEHLCRKAAAIHQLVPILRKALQADEMTGLCHELELPLSEVLARMELAGIRVDIGGLRQFGEELAGRLAGLIEQIYQIAGMEFNINSTKQLGEILFDKLGLPVMKKTKTGYSTDAEVLEKLEPYHEIISKLLYYRQLAKLQSTYIEGLLKEVRGDSQKIHTYYKQTIAATGRLSSQYPNLQNIPIRLEEGRKIRKVFVPSESGWHILAADYSQIELRVLAHISDDEKLKEAFLLNMDIHTKTAMDVFGVSENQVDGNMRRQAKAVNFGIVYGISDYGLSQNLNITRREAAQFIEQYFAVFQGVRKYMDDIVKQAKRDGYVTTLLQRRRYLPEIKQFQL